MQALVNDAYQNFANAIVVQAAEDYRNALNGKSYDKNISPEEVIEEVEKFFRSKHYRVLTKADPNYILERIRAEEGVYDESNIDTSNTQSD